MSQSQYRRDGKANMMQWLNGAALYRRCWVIMWMCCVMFVICIPTHDANANQNLRIGQYQGFTMRIELSPAKCSLFPSRSRLRQCREGFALTVQGLRPEPTKKGVRCSRKSARLPPLQTKVISRIMPDKVIRDLAWQHYGSCTGMSATHYFRMITKLSSQLNVPKELSSGNSYAVNRRLFERQMSDKNTSLLASHIQLLCHNEADTKSQVLTELQVCYDSAGKFSSCQQKVDNVCPTDFIIRGLP